MAQFQLLTRTHIRRKEMKFSASHACNQISEISNYEKKIF